MAKKPTYNNQYKVPSEKADEIWALNNKELINRMILESNNLKFIEVEKKENDTICALKNQIKEADAVMKDDLAYKEAEMSFKTVKESLVTEDLAHFKEELKNELEPINEEIKLYKGSFQLCMDEINDRKEKGILKIDFNEAGEFL